MHVRNYHTDKKSLLQKGQEIVKSSLEARYYSKVVAVNLVLNGQSPSELAKAMKESRGTITRWVKMADEKGFEALKIKSSPGRPSRLSEEQKEKIKAAIATYPSSFGYNVWDGISLSDYICKEHGVKVSVRQCQRLMHSFGYSLQRPRTFPNREPDSELRQEFDKKNEIENRDNTIVVFQDEVHFQITTSVTQMWAPVGEQPEIWSYPGKGSAKYSGFVMPSTGELFMAKPDWFTYETTIDSIIDFAKAHEASSLKYCIFMDNAPWHKKAKRIFESSEQYAKLRERISIELLPPYSPDLNPIERVWRIARREKKHNMFFHSLKQLKEVMDSYFSMYSAPNAKLASLCG